MQILTNRAGPPYALALLLILSACGEDGGTPGNGPVIFPPTANPSPTPSPPPTPTPTPQPILSDAALAGAVAGDTLGGVLQCARGSFFVSPDGTATSVSPPASVSWDGLFGLTISGNDNYSWDLNGFGGPTSTAAQKQAGYVAIDRFVEEPGSFFDIARKGEIALEYATLGLLSQYELICFYAAALHPSATATYVPMVQYGTGYADGFSQRGNEVMRLFGSRISATITNDGSYDVRLDLTAVPRALADPAFQERVDLGRAEARVALDAKNVGEGPLTGPSGFSGRVKLKATGSFYAAMVIQFEMRNSAGDVIWGVAALDANLM